MKAILCLIVVLALASTSTATHFRYQTMSWTRPSADSKTITATVKQAWRWSFWSPKPAVGATVSTGTWYWGDGSSVSVSGKVTSINTADDWFFIEWVATKTYPSSTTYIARFENCCRLSTLMNNNGDQSRNESVKTQIVLGSTALRSPQIASLPLIPFQINHDNSVRIPLIKDEQNNAVTFSVTSSANSGLNTIIPSPSNPSMPFQLTSDGLINWNPNTTGLYAFQLTATASNQNYVTLDVILMVNAAQADHTPPIWLAPTPSQRTIHFIPGNLVSFEISAGEDEVDDIHLQAASIPPGSSLSPACTNPAVNGKHNPCNGTFTWQTTAADADTIVCFLAADAVGNYADQMCVTLIADHITSGPCGGASCVLKNVAPACSQNGVSFTTQGKCATLSFGGTTC